MIAIRVCGGRVLYVAPPRDKRHVALKVVKSELKYAEAAMDEIELLSKVGGGGGGGGGGVQVPLYSWWFLECVY